MKLQLIIAIEGIAPSEPRELDETFISSLKESIETLSGEEVFVGKEMPKGLPLTFQKKLISGNFHDYQNLSEIASSSSIHVEVDAEIITMLSQQLEPIIIQYIDNQAAKEITIEIQDEKLILKDQSDFEKFFSIARSLGAQQE